MQIKSRYDSERLKIIDCQQRPTLIEIFNLFKRNVRLIAGNSF